MLQQVARRIFRWRSSDVYDVYRCTGTRSSHHSPDRARYGSPELLGSHVRFASRSWDLVCKLLCKVPCRHAVVNWCPYDRHLRARTRLQWLVMAARSCRLDRAWWLPCLAPARAGRCTHLRTHPAYWSQGGVLSVRGDQQEHGHQPLQPVHTRKPMSLSTQAVGAALLMHLAYTLWTMHMCRSDSCSGCVRSVLEEG